MENKTTFNYTYNLNDLEKALINTYREYRSELYSIFARLNIHNREGFYTGKQTTLLADVNKKYPIKKDKFRDLINLLEELGLVKRENRKIRVLKVTEQTLIDRNIKIPVIKVVETVKQSFNKVLDNTGVDPKECRVNNDNPTLTTDELLVLATEQLENKNIKNDKVKLEVVKKIKALKKDIQRLGASKYIATIISEKVSKIDDTKERNAMYFSKKSNNKELKFNNFPQREYDYDSLEKLEWDFDIAMTD